MTEACPPVLDLEAASALPLPPPSLTEHLAVCDACRARFEEIRDNNRFLDDLRPRLSPENIHPDALGAGLVPGFELIEEISRGGQGVVFRAVQTTTKRPAAVKMLLRGTGATERQRARFDREIEIAARLRHPGIVSVFESGVTADDRRFVAMEFVEGIPLDAYIRLHWPLEAGYSRPRTEAILRLLASVASAVGHAHAAGVIHRDLKPSNILVDAAGDPRILDFGLAREALSSSDVSVTQEFVGTLAFAAPEQFSGRPGATTSRTDVYALGVLLYCAVTERHPYPADGPFVEIMGQIAGTEPAPPSQFVPRLPQDIDAIILKSLSKDPARRYQGAGALASDIEDYLAGRPISARRDSAIYVLGRLARRHRVPFVAAALIAVIVLGAAIALAIVASNLDRERRAVVEALTESAVARARLLGAVGEVNIAERILWEEALRAGLDPDDPEEAVSPSAERRRAAWSLAEFYSRVPRRVRVELTHEPVQAHFETDGQAFTALTRDGVIARWTINGDLIESTPPFISPSITTFQVTTPDLSRLVAWDDGWLRIFDARTGRTLAESADGFAARPHLALSADGRLLAAATTDGTVRLLDGDTARQVGTLSTNAAPDYALAFTPEGDRLIASVDAESAPELRVWTMGSVEPARRLLVPSDVFMRSNPGIRVICAGRGLRNLAAICGESILVWRAGATEPIAADRSGMAQPVSLAFSDDESYLMAGTLEGVVYSWRLSDMARSPAIQNSGLVRSMHRVESRGEVLIADDARRISIYDAETQPWLRRMPTLGQTVHGMSLAPDGAKLAWSDDSGNIQTIDPAGSPIHPTIRTGPDMVTAVAWLPDGERLVCADIDGVVAIRRADTGAVERILLHAQERIWTAAISADGRSIAAAGDSGRIYLWPDERSPEPIVLAGGHEYRVPCVAFSPDGARLASVSTDRTALIWRLDSRTIESRLDGFGEFVRAAAWSPDGSMLATGGDDRAVHLWDGRTGQLLRTIGGLSRNVFDLAFHPSGRILFAATRSPNLEVLDPQSGAQLASIKAFDRPLYAVRVAQDGSAVIVGGEDPWVGAIDLDRLFGYLRGNARYWRHELAPGK